MRVLVVTYCPRGERSRTKQLADHVLSLLTAKKAEIEVLDIAKDVPDLFTPELLSAYYERNYAGQKISAEKTASLKKMDRMTAQLKKADAVILAYPMYNFSQPAIVKAWFDSVMQKGETWDITPKGYAGLMAGRKALVITSSGGAYQGQMAGWEHSASLSRTDFGFMGYEAESVAAEGMNMFPEKESEIIGEAKGKIKAVIDKWA